MLTGRYFMRIEIKADSLPFLLAEFRERFRPEVGEPLSMTWKITDSAVKNASSCWFPSRNTACTTCSPAGRSKRTGHRDPLRHLQPRHLPGFVEWHGIPFIHVPVTPDNKQAAYAEIQRIFDECAATPWSCPLHADPVAGTVRRLSGRIINIHHSFLPSFAGAKPYHQAYTRGVKLIGATCHYVTSELDAGPIVEQDVIRIDHSDSPEDMVRYGKDIEKTVLARGLRYHLEDRVLVHGNKTVVFR